MKTVIVFDTDDDQGMKDAHAIMSHLAKEHLGKRVPSNNTLSIQKIQFIKTIRSYGKLVAEGGDNGLKQAKEFTDELWEELVKKPF